MSVTYPPAWARRQHRPDLARQLAERRAVVGEDGRATKARAVVGEDGRASEDCSAELERWHWPSFGWGNVAGFYAGCMITAGAAYLWGFYL